MVVLDTFLGCFKLRSGCLFIGYTGTIFSMLCVILSGVGITFTAMRENVVTGDDKLANEIIMGVAIYIFIICAVSFALHVILLRGVYEKRPRLLNIYLITMTTYLVITFIAALVVTVSDPARGFSYVLSFALNIYYLLVVKSHRLEIENTTHQPPAYSKV